MKSRRPVPALGLTLQIRVECRLQLSDNAPGSKQQKYPAQQSRRQSCFRLVAGGLDHGLHGFGALATDQSLNGSDNLIVCRFSAKDEAGYGYCNNQKRSQREKRIVG